jgi:beta-lactam-binding protein with PASTA domain
MQCPVCGAVVFDSAAFCARCGAMTASQGHEESEAAPTRRSGSWLRIIAWGSVAAAALLFLASVCVGRSGLPAVRQVPDVIGRDRTDAEARLQRLGFECVARSGEFSATIPPGAVVRQFPQADTPTSTRKVTVLLSLGPRASGRTQQAALAARRGQWVAGHGEERQTSGSSPAGTLVTDGAPGRLSIRTEAPVRTAARVPDVTGKSGTDAKRLLRSADLTYLITAKRFSDSVPHGYVISQSPGPGSTLPRDKRVRVALSLGRGLLMPDVVGKPAQEAARLLTGMGLQIDQSRRHGDVQKDHVISSVPAAGENIAAGSRIALVISSGLAEGFLRVEAEPSDKEIWLYVDGGEPRGHCPTTVRLPAGEHSVILWEPTGQTRVAFPVMVQPEQTLTVRRDLGRDIS